jgi:hypothetical protein
MDEGKVVPLAPFVSRAARLISRRFFWETRVLLAAHGTRKFLSGQQRKREVKVRRWWRRRRVKELAARPDQRPLLLVGRIRYVILHMTGPSHVTHSIPLILVCVGSVHFFD